MKVIFNTDEHQTTAKRTYICGSESVRNTRAQPSHCLRRNNSIYSIFTLFNLFTL